MSYIMRCINIIIICIPLLGSCSIDNCSYYRKAIVSQITEFDTTGGDNNDDGTFFGFPWYQSSLGNGNDDFSSICRNPEQYLECFQNVIMDRTVNYRKKHMALYSMRLLGIDKYTTVVGLLNTAFTEGLIHEETLETAITQDGIWNNTVLVHFEDKKFQNEYMKIIQNPKLSKEVHAYLIKFKDPSYRKKLLEAFKLDRGYK